MLYGGPVKSVADIDGLKALRFDFGEVAIPNATSRRLWWESGVKNKFSDRFFLVGHGPPVEEPPDDVRYLWSQYLPALIATVDIARKMKIKLLTIHLCIAKQFITGLVRAEKIRALQELVRYGSDNGVLVSLENISESADDLVVALEAVPDLGLTLDVGHGQLFAPVNTSFEIVEKLAPSIHHVHLHDNRGGDSAADDLHLPIGKGAIDFPAILSALVRAGYDGTMTLELGLSELYESRSRIQAMIKQIPRLHGKAE